MPTWLLVVIAAVLCLAVTFRPWKQEQNRWCSKKDEDDGASLNHTIQVNLGLLKREADELIPIAEQAASSPDVDRARGLLEEAESTALDVDANLSMCVDADKDELLERVFGAMHKTAQARRLLGATKTPVDFLE